MCQQNNLQTKKTTTLHTTFFPDVSAIFVLITKIIHTTVKVTCCNVTGEPLETATKNTAH